ncbi:GL25233 [Drosophila persimilis]|uniref:GL25233 n=1 Tax=Drosophila persimilis TaxID=7234 RepID=B4GU48_DROPE|nr:GL25233 [Drosophila persimilis]
MSPPDAAKCDMLIDQLDWELLDVIGTDSSCSTAAEGQRYQAIKSTVLNYCGSDGQESQEWQQLTLQSN